MKKEEFSKALGEVDEKYVTEAINYNKSDLESQTTPIEPKAQKTKNFSKSMKVWRGIAIAACAILVLGGGFIGVAAILSNTGGYGSAKRDSYYDEPAESYYDGGDYKSYDYNYAAAEAAPEPMPAGGAYDAEAYYNNGMGSSTGTTTSEIPDNNFKIIYTAYMRMETTEFDAATKSIEEIVKANGAYFETSNVNSNSTSYRSAYYVVRIPADKLDGFLNQAEGVCTVISVNKSAEDVSESYYDIETRLNTARTKLDRLNELLAQATSMEDIITLESSISDTQWLIDSLSGSLQHYDSLVNYSTVTIDLTEVYKVEKDIAPLTFGEKVSKAFKNGLANFGDFLEDLVVFIADSWIWLLIVAGVIIAIIFIIKGIVKKHKNKQ